MLLDNQPVFFKVVKVMNKQGGIRNCSRLATKESELPNAMRS